jgi:pimeloyl-ACP methyl ester carboxylesterase
MVDLKRQIEAVDVLGFSLGGMVAQQMVQDHPSVFGG